MINYVLVDPGQTTGWTVLTPLGKQFHLSDMHLLHHDQEPDYNPERLLRTMQELVRPERVNILVIERPPERGNDPRLLQLFGKICAEAENLGYHQVETIYPGLWKPWIKRVGVRFPATKLRRHEKDSYLMGAFFFATRRGMKVQ